MRTTEPRQALPDFMIHEPMRTPAPTPEPRQALPDYLIHEPAPTLPYFSPSPQPTKESQPSEMEGSMSWCFSRQEIGQLREELRAGGYRGRDEQFMERIEIDRVKG